MKLRTKGCCGCDQCALECRTAEGTATLCGFDEFTDPSTPPKKYRRRTVTGEMRICTSRSPDCSFSICAQSYSDGGEILLPFYGTTATWSAALTPDGPPSGGSRFYTASAIATRGDGSSEVAARVVLTYPGGGTEIFNNFESRAIAVMPEVTVSAQVFTPFYGWTGTAASKCMSMEPLSHRVDLWDLVQQFDAETCAITTPTDDSHSYTSDTCGGTDTEIDPPESTDYANVTVEQDQTTKTITGDGVCHPDGVGGYVIYTSPSDPVELVLSDEDTPADAIAREGEPTWETPTCDSPSASAFVSPWGGEGVFTYRRMQVRAAVGSVAHPTVIGHSYRVTIGIYRRELASGGAFVFFANVEVTVSADTTPVDWTDWFDVPNEEGLETRVGSCSVEDLGA